MKRFIISIFLTAIMSFTTSAETFEKVIERQPPETEKNFFGVTNFILSKTNNLLGGVVDVLTGINTGDLNSIVDGFEKGTDTFKKFQAAHKQTLANQLKTTEKAVAALVSSGYTGADMAHAYLELGRVATEAGDFSKARDAYAEALRIAEDPSQKLQSLQFDILLAMSDCAYTSYDTEYMLNVSNQLEKLVTKDYKDDTNRRVNAKLVSGRCKMRLGNNAGAVRNFQEAYSLAVSDDNFNYAEPVFNRLQVDLLKKFPDLGLLSECVQMLDLFVGADSPIESFLQPDVRAQMLVVVADCYSRLNNHSKAFDNIFKARDIIQKAYPDGSIAELEYLVTLGDLLRRNAFSNEGTVSNDYTKKGVMYHLNGCRLLATRIWGNEKDGVNPWLRRINSKLALAAVVDCKIKAEQLKKYTKPTTSKDLQVFAGKAKYTASEEEFIRLASLANKSLKLARKLYDSELEYMRDKIKTDFTTMDESQRADYMTLMSELVNDIYNFADFDSEDKGTAAMVYDATLLSKSVLLSFSRSLAPSVRAMGDPALTASLDELNAKRREYVRLEQNGDFKSSALLRREAGEIERSLQRAIASSNPGSFMSTTWKDIKSGLSKKDAAVEFYTFTDNLSGGGELRERMVVVASNKNPKVFPIRFRQGNVTAFNPTHRRLLYSSIWKPLEKEKFLKEGGTVYFAPAGRWNGVPLEYLPAEKGDMNNQYKMVRVSTTRNRPAATTPVMDTPVLFGGLDYNLGIDDMAQIREEIAETGMRGPLPSGLWNHLPGTEIEVSDIASIFSNNSKDCLLITGAEGIEESFKALSGGDHAIVHVATHGYYCPSEKALKLHSESVKMDEAMDQSGLVFSGANQYLVGVKGEDGLDNGLLTSREIALMDLSNTDLVVMSACDTGTGKATSEGVMGLQRGFKLAGANTLVMSLWKVNDQATAAMMSAFYRHLSEGKDKRSAFYSAREELSKATFKNSAGSDISGSDPKIVDAFVIMD